MNGDAAARDEPDEAEKALAAPAGKMETPLQRIRREVLWRHNACRDRHNLAPLKLDSRINRYSQAWAAKMAKTRKFEQSPRSARPTYQENIFMGGSSTFEMAKVNGVEIAAFFCDDMTENAMDRFVHSWNSISTGTTELAWKTSTELGVGMATTKQGKMDYVYICCNYS